LLVVLARQWASWLWLVTYVFRVACELPRGKSQRRGLFFPSLVPGLLLAPNWRGP
jgi:hypothetical protein